MPYDWIAVGALCATIGTQLMLIRALKDTRRLRNQMRELHRQAADQRATDQALLDSAKATIQVLDEDFDAAIKVSVERIVHWRNLAKRLAHEIREQPSFDSHLTGSADGCSLCDLLREASQS